MMRKHIVVGDSSACGGTVLPFGCRAPFEINGCQLALIGGRVLCAVCNTVGHIAKAGGPYRSEYSEAENALEGDMVVCECATPSPLISTFASNWSCDDRGNFAGEFDVNNMLPGWYRPDVHALTTSKRVLEKVITHMPVADSGDLICANMTNEKFAHDIIERRDHAVRLLEKRLSELRKRDDECRARVKMWFGRDDNGAHEFLAKGFTICLDILKGLGVRNFIRYSEIFGRNVGCVADMRPEVAAGVCKPDSKSRTIALTLLFCGLRATSPEWDSQLSTLIHEVTHFTDAFDSQDIAGGFLKSLELAHTDSVLAMKNADNFAGYVVWGEIYGS